MAQYTDHQQSQTVLEARDFIARHAASGNGDVLDSLDIISALLGDLDRAHGIIKRPVRSVATLEDRRGMRGQQVTPAVLEELGQRARDKGMVLELNLDGVTLTLTGSSVDIWSFEKAVMDLIEDSSLLDEQGEHSGSLRNLLSELTTSFTD